MISRAVSAPSAHHADPRRPAVRLCVSLRTDHPVRHGIGRPPQSLGCRPERRVRACPRPPRQPRYVIRCLRSSPSCAESSTDNSAAGCSNSEGVNKCAWLGKRNAWAGISQAAACGRTYDQTALSTFALSELAFAQSSTTVRGQTTRSCAPPNSRPTPPSTAALACPAAPSLSGPSQPRPSRSDRSPRRRRSLEPGNDRSGPALWTGHRSCRRR
jgi:hypothetical protein